MHHRKDERNLERWCEVDFLVHSNSTVDFFVKYQLGFLDVHLISWFYLFNSRGINLGPSPKHQKTRWSTIWGVKNMPVSQHLGLEFHVRPLSFPKMNTTLKGVPHVVPKTHDPTFVSKEPLFFRSSKKEPWIKHSGSAFVFVVNRAIGLGKTKESFQRMCFFSNKSVRW